MKYFTSELWSNAGNPDKTKRERAHRQWHENDEAYGKIFDNVKKRLPENFLKVYFSNAGFRDFKLLSFGLDQVIGGKKNPTSFHIDIESYKGNIAYRITYKFPIKCKVHYEGEICSAGFDDWEYCEFLPVDKKTLSHEILFASDATILIYFHDKNISIEQIR